ncbi:MAG TPA: hypothetical protein VES67_03270 [Vicinamibacterales bacterium]|nr:hypothetical protein [Vicinamibacterales bacterium]
MDNTQAIHLLDEAMQEFRREPYRDLVTRIGQGPVTAERQGADAAQYQLEFSFVWDDRPGGNVRVIGSIDDGGWRAFVPVTRSFIKSADESFVDE